MSNENKFVPPEEKAIQLLIDSAAEDNCTLMSEGLYLLMQSLTDKSKIKELHTLWEKNAILWSSIRSLIISLKQGQLINSSFADERMKDVQTMIEDLNKLDRVIDKFLIDHKNT
jgi:hypothetical protein